MVSVVLYLMLFFGREGNAPPVQGRAVLPGRGRAGPVVDPHRLAPPPGAPQAQALKLEEQPAMACIYV